MTDVDPKDVILHVYQLTDVVPGPPAARSGNNNANAAAGNWFTRTFLPAIGLGAYHTSLQVHGYRFTFTGNYGIVKCFSHVERTGLPPNAVFQESIKLGRTNYEKGEANAIAKKLGDEFFKPPAYNLLNRNCNHFTETFANALLLTKSDLAEPLCMGLETYPQWVNRLASTGQVVVAKDGRVLSCVPIDEARKAVGADKMVGWSLKSSTTSTNSTASTSSSTSTKKELSDSQQAALAKIRTVN